MGNQRRRFAFVLAFLFSSTPLVLAGGNVSYLAPKRRIFCKFIHSNRLRIAECLAVRDVRDLVWFDGFLRGEFTANREPESAQTRKPNGAVELECGCPGLTRLAAPAVLRIRRLYGTLARHGQDSIAKTRTE
jgi:hypothetical protein